ncbi:MAG: ATP-binding cassette domain-containing protein [Phycisphaerales bacterium]
MIRVEGVSRSFAGVPAVSGVTLEVPEGRTVALIGPSGCGKSTLLRLMIGLLRPDAGLVRFDDEPLNEANTRRLRRRVGYAIQSGGLFPHLTARRNVEIPLRAHGERRRDARLVELAELVRLDRELLDRYPSELSGGQRQRVALMRALVLDPEALLLDEPLGALDPMVRAELQADLRELFATLGKTVVLVTHDLAEAAYLAPEDIVLLREGRIEQRGSFAALRAAPEASFTRRFIDAQASRVAALTGAAS